MALLLASVLFGHGSFILFHTGVDRCFCWRPLSFIAAAAPACSCSLSCHISHWLALFICYQLASSCDHRVRRWTPSRRVLPCSTRSNKRAFNRQGADIWVWSGLVTASLVSISWFIIVQTETATWYKLDFIAISRDKVILYKRLVDDGRHCFSIVRLLFAVVVMDADENTSHSSSMAN